ncbi:MAG: dienelactone hydrolase family protein [Xanthomonadales bacterium]|nr:dienelactone hydrolase family protein [Xanthomonadales bacterium]
MRRLRDVRAAERRLAAEAPGLAVAALGFCWGGTLAALCATRLGLPAVAYYGARTGPFLHERPQAPLLMHFGEHDALFPLAEVERLRRAWPTAEVHLYPAGHGFNCDARPDFHAESAAQAWDRSLRFLAALADRP